MNFMTKERFILLLCTLNAVKIWLNDFVHVKLYARVCAFAISRGKSHTHTYIITNRLQFCGEIFLTFL